MDHALLRRCGVALLVADNIKPIRAWNISSVNYLASMFSSAKVFRQPIGAWNTSRVNSMSNMFSGAHRIQPTHRILGPKSLTCHSCSAMPPPLVNPSVLGTLPGA